ncbi:hypothetical protein FE633_37925 [Streptomyces montanus]|uniref:Uncharacterized protein n=1 Tax=Streptomyces montanus TaxID=2580423 RepID=A0A5R9FHJ3_9ACTN|nr:hypothetical protein FE633_37925 [Streptomyces montanus]
MTSSARRRSCAPTRSTRARRTTHARGRSGFAAGGRRRVSSPPPPLPVPSRTWGLRPQTPVKVSPSGV